MSFAAQSSASAPAAAPPGLPAQAGIYTVDHIYAQDEEIDQFLQHNQAQIEHLVNKSTSVWKPHVFTWDMDTLVLHSELPEGRTCQTTQNLLTAEICGVKRKCITCQALSNMQSRRSVEAARAAGALCTFVGSKNYSNWDEEDIFKDICVGFLKDVPEYRKTLSWYGAVRVPRDRCMAILQTPESLNNYWVWMLKAADQSRAYTMFHDYGNPIMANWLETLCIDDLKSYNEVSKGDFVEAVLSIGWWYKQADGQHRHILQHAIKVVPWIENNLDRVMTAQNGTIPVRNWIKEKDEAPQEKDAPMGDAVAYATKAEMLELYHGIQQVLKSIDQNFTNLNIRLTSALATGAQQLQMVVVEAVGTQDNEIDQDERAEIDTFLEKRINGDKSWLPDRTCLETPRDYEKRLRNMQSEIFKMLREGYSKNYLGQGIQGVVPTTNYWTPYGHIADHLHHKEVWGEFAEKDFWQVLLHTVHDKDKEHATYQVLEITYPGIKGSFVLVRLRELPDALKKQADGGKGSGYKGQKRAREWHQ